MDTPTLPPVGAAAPISSSPPNREPRALIGDFIRRPAWLWLTHVAPLLLMLAWASHTYWLVESDLNAAQRAESLVLAVGLIATTAGAAFMALASQLRGRLLGNGACGLLLLMSLAVLGIALRFCWTTIPWSVPEWLANQSELLFESFCLGMPGAFYAVLVLASQPLRRHGGVEFAGLVGVTVVGAMTFYAIVCGIAALERATGYPEWLGDCLGLFGAFAGGTAVTFLITRATLLAYNGLRRTSPTLQRVFMFAVAVCGPIGGLYLNKTLPFPVDLQAPVIYLLALLNGGLLMLPSLRSIFWHRVIWLAQCALFPFSAYFFFLFLPFLPLSLFAMIALGAGFLMLVPLVLGISHACRLADGFREEVRDGKRWPVAVMGLSAILALPALGTWSMWQDREALDEALTYIYSPDYRNDVTYPGNLPALASSLQHLRDAKQGIFLPFITPLYDAIVFHGLVLPDAKINDLQTAFFGTAAAKEPNALLRSRRDDNWQDWRGPERPDHDVALTDVQVTEQRAGATGTAQLLLTMQNHSDSGEFMNSAEFLTSLHLPEGVYVTGFALKIGNDFVPARITEKKTAQWVYEQITQVYTMDPGLLVYTSRTDLSLKIAPFDKDQVRQARLDLAYAGNAPVAVTIGDRSVTLGADMHPTAPLAVTSCATDGGSLAIANVANAADWQITRTPYLDILIDCSRGTAYSPASLAAAIDQARKAFPGATMARVSAINFEARDLVPNLTALDQLNAADLSANLLPRRGGLLQDRFLKRGLLLAGDLMQTGEAQAKMRPQFVLISSLGQPGLRENRLENFLRLAPDARVIYAENVNGNFSGVDLATRQAATLDEAPVALWKWDGHYAVSPANARMIASFPGGAKSGAPQLYQPATGQFITPSALTSIASDARFADGVRNWAAQDDADYDPQLLANGAAALIGLSKQTGILVPDSSYIAVESMSQWRILEEKEKQKLANKQVFEFEEPVATPEPGTWVLLLAGLVILALARKRADFKVSARSTIKADFRRDS